MNIFSATLLLFALFAFGCSSTEAPDDSGTNSGVGTDTLSGVLDLIDSHNRIIPDRAGIPVTLEGTASTTVTDSMGRWSFVNLPLGHHTIVASKPGYYTYRDTISLLSPASRYTRNIYLRESARYKPMLDAIAVPTDTFFWGSVYAHTFVTDTTILKLGAMLVIGRTPKLNLSVRNSYVQAANSFYSSFIRGTDSLMNMTYSLDYVFLTKNGFITGDTIYFKLYPSFSAYRTFNPDDDGPVAKSYDELGSNVLSAILP